MMTMMMVVVMVITTMMVSDILVNESENKYEHYEFN